MAPLDERANHARDRRIRRDFLQRLNDGRSNTDGGWMSGRHILDLQQQYAPRANRPANNDAALSLLRDLQNGGYAEFQDDREYKWQAMDLDFSSFRITAKGTALLAEAIEVDPLIEDDRIG